MPRGYEPRTPDQLEWDEARPLTREELIQVGDLYRLGPGFETGTMIAGSPEVGLTCEAARARLGDKAEIRRPEAVASW